MHHVGELEVGLMFWADGSAEQTIQRVKGLGLRSGQLGINGEYPIGGFTQEWMDVLRTERFGLATVVCSYAGEDYADVPTVLATVGFMPPSTRNERVARTKYVADFAAQISVPSVACHIGFIPEDSKERAYGEMVKVVRDLCDHCAFLNQTFALETGQEPAAVLRRFIHDVERPNLRINFDPANLILYGTGDPLEALEVLGPYVVSVHCKDGDYPPVDQPNVLGKERALGEGSVNVPEFISKLKQMGYRGILSIEREEQNPTVREADIKKAITLLLELRD
jgi:sugar phosphate isomerase/epimerase